MRTQWIISMGLCQDGFGVRARVPGSRSIVSRLSMVGFGIGPWSLRKREPTQGACWRRLLIDQLDTGSVLLKTGEAAVEANLG
jgi:hypothetical protein